MGIIYKQIRLVGSRGEHETNGLFDAGASYSFIRRDIAERLATLEPLPQPMSFEMAQRGATMTVRERVLLDFGIVWLPFFRRVSGAGRPF